MFLSPEGIIHHLLRRGDVLQLETLVTGPKVKPLLESLESMLLKNNEIPRDSKLISDPRNMKGRYRGFWLAAPGKGCKTWETSKS